MSESEQDVQEGDQSFVCPCDPSHRLPVAEKEKQLIECKGNVAIDEKAICPFNDKHAIFATEMDYHDLKCPDNPRENGIRLQNGNKVEASEATPKKQLFDVFSSTTTYSVTSCETASTGCESGLRLVGGIRSCDSLIGETDGSDANAIHSYPDLVSNGERQSADDGFHEGCYDDSREIDPIQVNEGLMSSTHNTLIEKQLEELESDLSSGTNSSAMETVERFDYTKYIPSKDLREDFLKLIGQPRNDQMLGKYEMLNQQCYGSIQQWPPNGYNYNPTLYHTPNGFHSPSVQPAYLSFSNTYHIIPAVSAQAPYSGSYGFQSKSPGLGSFLHTQDHVYDYNMYPATRPNYHRPYFKRRNHYHFHPRYHNNESYNSNNHDNHHNQSYINGFNQSEDSVIENSCHLDKLNGIASHNDDTSKSHRTWMKNGCDSTKQELLSPKLSHSSSEVEDTKGKQQFVYIGEVSDKMQCGDAKSDNQENHCTTIKSNIRMSETEKQIRKVKKKLAAISEMEKKLHQGVNLDCDQLKKLSRKTEFEDQLQSLYLS